MPTYDYVCRACGYRFEVLHGVHDHGPTQCPNCHAHALRKAIAAPTFLFKGTGWAKKDRGAANATKAAAKAEAGGGAGRGANAGSSGSPEASGGSGDSSAGDADEGPRSGPGRDVTTSTGGPPGAVRSSEAKGASKGSGSSSSAPAGTD